MKKEFQAIQIVHGALCVGSLLFFLIVYFVLGTEESAFGQDEDIMVFSYLAPVLLLSGLVLSRVMDRTRLGAFKFPAALSEKVVDYRSRVVLRSALIEGPLLFVVIILLLTGNNINIIYFGIGLLALLYVRPHLGEFARDYKLSGQEQQEMNE